MFNLSHFLNLSVGLHNKSGNEECCSVCCMAHLTSCVNVPRTGNWRHVLSARVMVVVMVQDREFLNYGYSGPQRPAQATLHNWSPGPHLLRSREEQALLVNSSKWGPLVSSQTPPTFFILLSLPTHCCSPQQQLSMLVRSHLSSPWTTAVPLFLHPHNYLFSLGQKCPAIPSSLI